MIDLEVSPGAKADAAAEELQIISDGMSEASASMVRVLRATPPTWPKGPYDVSALPAELKTLEPPAQIGPPRQCIGRDCTRPAVHKYGDAKWRKLCTACNKKRVEAHRSSRQSGPCACGNNSKAGETMCGPCLKANSSAQIWTAAIFQLTKVADDLSEMGMGPKAKLIREAIYAVENF